MPVPAVRAQPIDVRDVATTSPTWQPRDRVPDLGGPEITPLRELARDYLGAVGKRSPTVALSFPGRVFRGYREGADLVPANPAGTTTFTEYLAP